MKYEAFNHLILPLLIVPEWIYRSPNSKGLAFYTQKNKCVFTKNVELKVSNYQTHFFKVCTFLVAALFPYSLAPNRRGVGKVKEELENYQNLISGEVGINGEYWKIPLNLIGFFCF